MCDPLRVVDPQDIDGRACRRAFTREPGTIPGEVFVPPILARIEQWNQLISLGIVAGDVWSLGGVAGRAGPTEVPQARATVMLPRLYVVHFVGQRCVSLRQLAILTQVAGSFGHAPTPRLGHDSMSLGRLLEGKPRLGLDEIQQLAHAQKPLQGNALGRADCTMVVLPQKLTDALCAS